MAGIGFELRRILNRETYSATLQAYLYAGLISSGPWVLSILSVLIIGIMSLGVVEKDFMVVQFLVSVTYLMAASLTFTGGAQLLFTRFVSDRLFENKHDIILPNLFGLLTLNTTIAAIAGGAFCLLAFTDESLLFRLLMLSNFVTLTNLWLVVIFLSGMKAYNRILGIMAIGYGFLVFAAYFLRENSLEGLMLSFLLGHGFLLFAFLAEIIRDFVPERLLAFDFLKKEKIYISLMFTGLAYYAGIWVDKFLFWFNPLTSEAIIGPLRASAIYDIPIFLAYLTIIPGMAVFLVRIETDFAEHYERLYDAIRGGEALDHVYYLKDKMVGSVRQGLMEIFKVQGVTILLTFLWAPEILAMLGISDFYLPLLYVDVIGVSVQIVLMATLNVFFYLDRRENVLFITCLFLVTNIALTLWTQSLGPVYFGYGFVGSTVLATLVALIILNRVMRDLEYETFMLAR